MMDQRYWDDRFKNVDTPWDMGMVSPPMARLASNLPDKSISILIPGAGSGHEVAHFWNVGFANTFLCDWSLTATSSFIESHPEFPKHQVLHTDFFKLDRKFDLILEQTFFCALPPHMRTDYVSKMHELLESNGILCGLLFASEFDRQGPPFGGTETEYMQLFTHHFDIRTLEICQDSHPARQGNELWFEFIRK